MTDIKNLEQLFFKVIHDMEEYLPYLVLVGGWIPYLYAKCLWKNLSFYPVTTTDIDFGVLENDGAPLVSETIYSRFSRLQYRERHLEIGRMFPIVPMLESAGKTSRLMIEFITAPGVDSGYIEDLVGRQILVNRLDKFDILFRDSIQITLRKSGGRIYRVNIPPPYLFLFHKALTFADREDGAKKPKDLYYIYYILRFHPRIDVLFDELRGLTLHEEKVQIVMSLRTLFSRVTGEGCLMVERENGPDAYIDNVRQDVFERFSLLIDIFDM